MSVKLTVERQTLSFDTDAIGIGRDPDNQVALPNDTRLAPLHAVLRFVNGRWIIESRDGGPVRIGNGRPSRFSWLNPGDVIHLTETGPELIFEPGPVGSPGLVPPSMPQTQSRPIPASAGVSATAAYVPFIPHLSGETPAPKVVANPVKSVLPKIRIAESPPANRQLPMIIALGIASALMLVVVAWGLVSWTRRPPQDPSVDAVAIAPPVPDPVPVSPAVPSPITAKSPLDPQEFLVLVGIGDLKTDDRPHVLGVGWLWDERTAVTSRSVGSAIAEVVSETRRDGNPRQGCVIQGVAFEVAQVIQPEGCPEISILRLKEPVELSITAREQWKKTNAAGVERLRGLGKSLAYFSYDPLPRPASVQGKHGFPLCEYDPDKCHLRHEEARLLYQQPQHFLKPDESATRLERGGLLVDDDRKIVGMAPLNSSIVWTETLERAFDFRAP